MLSHRPASQQRYQTLLEINNALVTNLTKHDLLHATCHALQKAIPFDMAGIALYEPDLDGLRFFALEGQPSSDHFVVGRVLDRADCCFGEAFDRQSPVLRCNLDRERKFSSDDFLLAEGILSYCTVPLIVAGKSIGAISVTSRARGQYSPDDAAFLQEAATQIALAVGNMKAYEEIAALKSRLQDENVSLQQEVRQAELLVLLAENAASMGRFAAALAHELNSPLGALRSAVQCTRMLAEKKDRPAEEKPADREAMEAQLHQTMADSAERLHQVVLRMQRFTNLDRAEVLPVDLNVLLQDVVGLLGPQRGDVRLDLRLQALPAVSVRPQQISAVLSNVLHNALDQGNGSKQVTVTTQPLASKVEVVVEDDGRGMPATELGGVFDPVFKVTGNRLASGNWSLFSSRQIVRAHGGDISIESSPGQGTRVSVSLPCNGSSLGPVTAPAGSTSH